MARLDDGQGTILLLVEDDVETAGEIVTYFSDRGFGIVHLVNGVEGLAAARGEEFALLIAGRSLPGMDGLSLVEALRQAGRHVPALVLSAVGEMDDRVRRLRAAGDDYLTKPFEVAELAARVDALLRQPSVMTDDTLLHVGPLELDVMQGRARRGERDIELLPRECRLLAYLMRRPGQLVTRAVLLEEVWNYSFLTETNLVEVHMGKLRRKIDAIGDEPMIESIRGMGYMLCAPKAGE